MLQRVRDVRVLKALGHPVRARILHELYALGSARAADLAGTLDLPANQVSYHLRQLARHDLIERAPEAERDARDRAWRPTSPSGLAVNPDELAQTEGGETIVAAYRRSVADFTIDLVERAWAPGSAEQAMASYSPLRLTPDEASTFASELEEFVGRWREATQGERPADSAADAQTYLFLQILQPYPD